MILKTLIALSLMMMAATCLAVGEVIIKDGESIAFLGDSITYLGNAQKPTGYVNLVMEGLKAAGVKAGLLINATRVAIVGQAVAPPLFDTMVVLGQERVARRLRAALAEFGKA